MDSTRTILVPLDFEAASLAALRTAIELGKRIEAATADFVARPEGRSEARATPGGRGIEFEGDLYPTVEHAFQAAKTADVAERARIRDLGTPDAAKRAGRKVALRRDWERVKLGIMESLLRTKFSEPGLMAQLLETGERELVEGNTWNDRFWGVCRGAGANHLGRLLMKVRSELAISRGSRLEV